MINKVFRAFMVLIPGALIVTICAGGLVASEDRIDRALQRLDQGQVLTFGSADQKQPVYNKLSEGAAQNTADIHNVAEQARSQAAPQQIEKPDLKGPTGGGMPVSAAEKKGETVAVESVAVPSALYNVARGHGDNQQWLEAQAGGVQYRYFTEEFNGVRHVYVGFDDSGSDTNLTGAMNVARAGDIVLVRGGPGITYSENVSVRDGVRLYGGYGMDGSRHLENLPSTITGTMTVSGALQPTEINGFNFFNGGTLRITEGSQDVSVFNNHFSNLEPMAIGISVLHTSNANIRNNIFNGGICIAVDDYVDRGVDANGNRIVSHLYVEGNDFSGNIAVAVRATNDYATVESRRNNYGRGPNTGQTLEWAFTKPVTGCYITSSEDYFGVTQKGFSIYSRASQGPNTINVVSGFMKSPVEVTADHLILALVGHRVEAAAGPAEALAASPADRNTLEESMIGQSLLAGQEAAVDTLADTFARDASAGGPLKDGAAADDAGAFGADGLLALAQDFRGSLVIGREAVMTAAEAAEAADAELAALGDLVTSLRAKEGRTRTEELILETAEAIIRDSAEISDEAMLGLAEAINYVRIAETMRQVIPGVDFAAITGALAAFVRAQNDAYVAYLDATESAYEELADMLGIDVEKTLLPTAFRPLPDMTMRAKRKILVDLAIESARMKDGAGLTAAERGAIAKYLGRIEPLRQAFMKDLQDAIKKFTGAVKGALKDAPLLSVRQRDRNKEVLMLIDDRVKK